MEADSKERVEIDVLLKMYEQCQHNFRAFIDLRFKHFTTFVALNSFLALGVFLKIHNTLMQMSLSIFGLVMTSLFWILDYRTHNHLMQNVENIHSLTKALKRHLSTFHEPSPHGKKKIFLSANEVTNTLFGLFTGGWLFILGYVFVKRILFPLFCS